MTPRFRTQEPRGQDSAHYERTLDHERGYQGMLSRGDGYPVDSEPSQFSVRLRSPLKIAQLSRQRLPIVDPYTIRAWLRLANRGLVDPTGKATDLIA